MNKQFENPEEKLKDQLRDYEVNVPEPLFDAILEKRAKRNASEKKQSGKKYLWLLLLLLLPLVCTKMNFINNEKTKTEAAHSDLNSNNSEENPITHENLSSDNSEEILLESNVVTSADEIAANTQENKNNIKVLVRKPQHASERKGELRTENYGGTMNHSSSTGIISEDQIKKEMSLTEDLANSQSDGQNNFTSEFSTLPILFFLPTQNIFINIQADDEPLIFIRNDFSPVSDGLTGNVIEIPLIAKDNERRWSLEAFYSPDFSFQQLQDNADDSLSLISYDHKLKKSYSAGLRIEYRFTEHLFLKSGICYSHDQSSFLFPSHLTVPIITPYGIPSNRLNISSIVIR